MEFFLSFCTTAQVLSTSLDYARLEHTATVIAFSACPVVCRLDGWLVILVNRASNSAEYFQISSGGFPINSPPAVLSLPSLSAM